MPRSFFLLVVLAFSFASGCRMCGSPYDYCVPTHIDRAEDYRGCDPKYRAGSIFYASYDGCSDADILTAGLTMNTGNFGITTPINEGERQPKRLDNGEKRIIGVPTDSLDSIGNTLETLNDRERPDIDDILQQTPVNRLDTPSMPSNLPGVPLVPPSRTPVPQTPSPDAIETIPFTTPSSEQPLMEPINNVNPPVTRAPEITIEELRRLDPTVTDIKILNVEDSLNTATPHLTPRR